MRPGGCRVCEVRAGLECAVGSQAPWRTAPLLPFHQHHAMKLATLQDGSRDGQLALVSRDLGMAHYATWHRQPPAAGAGRLGLLRAAVAGPVRQPQRGRARHAFPFDTQQCMAPLPRAPTSACRATPTCTPPLEYQARNTDLPASLRREPLLQQAAGDASLGPCDEIVVPAPPWASTLVRAWPWSRGDVERGCTPAQALDGIRLLMLANTVSLRALETIERERPGAAASAARPPPFSPVAVTLDELGPAWGAGPVHLTLQSTWNGRKVGLCDAGPEMDFHFGQLIAQACTTRPLRAGSIVCSGPVSNPPCRPPGPQTIGPGLQQHCRQARHGDPAGRPARHRVHAGRGHHPHRDEGRDGLSLCGAIDQNVAVPPERTAEERGTHAERSSAPLLAS